MTAGRQYPPLCGGTFFDLLLASRRQGHSRRDCLDSVTDPNAQTLVLRNLMSTVTFSCPKMKESTAKTAVSTFRHCRAETPKCLPLTWPQYIDSFRSDMSPERYGGLLSRTAAFLGGLMDAESVPVRTRLVRAVLELILQNPDDGFEYRILPGGGAVSYGELKGMRSFELEPFILGVWHHIVVNRIPNSVDRQLFDSWAGSDGRGDSLPFTPEVRLTGAPSPEDLKERKERQKEKEQEQAPQPDGRPPAEAFPAPGPQPSPAPVTAVNSGSGIQAGTINGGVTVHYHMAAPAAGAGFSELLELSRLSRERYSLFVLEEEQLDGCAFTVGREGCLERYVSEGVRARFLPLTPEAVEEIKTLPSIIATVNRRLNRTDEFHPACLARVTGVALLKGGIRFTFRPYSAAVMQEILNGSPAAFGLYSAPLRNELSEPHWAIKEKDLLKALEEHGVNIFNRFQPGG